MITNNEDKTTANWLKEAQKGYIRMGVLILLNKKPSHGYEIMKEINCRTKGFWQPTAGGVYPILRDLEKSEYIKGQMLLFMANKQCTWEEIKDAIKSIEKDMKEPKKKVEKRGH